MKKLLLSFLFLSMFALLLSTMFTSCEKDDGKACCWVFVVTQKTSVNPSMAGYPIYSTTKTTQCDLTGSQADEVAKKLTSKTSSYSHGRTVTLTTTVTKYKEGETPEIPTSQRVVITQ